MSDKYEERRREWLRRTRERAEPERDTAFATDDAAILGAAATRLVAASTGVGWYDRPGNETDAAVAALCRLRRAGAGRSRASEGGDAAVRKALEEAGGEAVVWLASRAISYMDENGFPELVEPWLEHH